MQRQSRVLVSAKELNDILLRYISPQEIYLNNISLSSFAETKAPTWVEDGNFRQSTRFLECHPVTSPPTNQEKITHLAALTSNLPIKTVPLKTFKNSCFLSMSCPFSLHGPSVNFSLLQTLMFGLFGFTVYQAYEPVLNSLYTLNQGDNIQP